MPAPSSDQAGIRQTIRALKNADYMLTHVYDGEDDVFDMDTEQEVVDAITAVDDAYLHVLRGADHGWVRFVMGNEPYEVICDHTVNLSPVLDPLTEKWSS